MKKGNMIRGGGGAAPLALLLFFFLCSCNGAKHSFASDDTEAETDVLTLIEEDAVPDADVDEVIPNTHTGNEECPPLIEAKFPYYDKDGAIHFCRKCDTPTVKDPQCVQNLWRELHRKLAHDHPDVSCYPYPCEMGNLYPRTKEQFYTEEPDAPQYVAMHECDLKLANYGWTTGPSSHVKHWNLSNGKIGFLMDERAEVDITQYAIADQFFLYDTSSMKYSVISPSDPGFVYQNGKALLYFRDSRSFELGFPYIYVGYFGTDGTYRVVFNKPIYSILYTPALNEKWAFANINFVKNGVSTMYYAKVGEWKWTALGQGVAYHPDLWGDLLSISDQDFNGYVCNLAKGPKSLDECRKLNRGNELVSEIQFDRSGAKRIAYTSDYDRAIVLVTYEGDFENMTYSDLITDFTPESASNPWSLYVERLNGDILLYREVTMSGSGSTSGGRACFYRLDEGKKYCMKKMENDPQYGEWVVFPYGHSEYEGKWFLYQKQNNSPLILRDMDCYCAKEGVCPFEGLKR